MCQSTRQPYRTPSLAPKRGARGGYLDGRRAERQPDDMDAWPPGPNAALRAANSSVRIGHTQVVLKSVTDSRAGGAAPCFVSTRRRPAGQDHPAYIPRLGSWTWLTPEPLVFPGVMRSEVLFIGGRAGVGKSSVGSEIHTQLSAARVWHAFIEGDNLDLAYPPPSEHHLAERNLAAVWSNY